MVARIPALIFGGIMGIGLYLLYFRALGKLWQLLQLPKQELRVINFAGLECPDLVIDPVY